jgi:hypothetical protein
MKLNAGIRVTSKFHVLTDSPSAATLAPSMTLRAE